MPAFGTLAQPPGGFDPGALPPPPDPAAEADRFAAYVAPRLDVSRAPTSPAPQQTPSMPETPAMDAGWSPAPHPGQFQGQTGQSFEGSPAEQADAFARYVAPRLEAPSTNPLDRYRDWRAPEMPSFPIPEAIGRGIGALGQVAGITSQVGEPQSEAGRAGIAGQFSMEPGEVERAYNIASLALGAEGPRAGQYEPNPRDFAAWMQHRKDLAAGQTKGPSQQSPMSMREYEQYAREQAAAETEAARPTLSGDEALGRMEKMYAEGPTRAAQPLRERWDNLTTAFSRAWTDAGVDLSNIERLAQNNLGRNLDAREMASVQSRLNPFYTARIAVDEGVRPAINDLSDADYGDMVKILTAKGNIDVAAAKGNPGRVFSGDLTAADSQAGLDALRQRIGPERYAELERRGQSIVDFNMDELERDVRAGLVSRAQADEWLQQYPNYTPVVISDYLKEQGRAIGGRSLNVQGTGYKTLTEEGTARARIDPVAATIDAAYQGEALRRQNTSWRALHDLIQRDPALQDMFQIQKGGYTGATTYENSVSGFIDGERYTITTPFPDVARAIRQEAGGVNVPGWNTAMTLYKELITGRNPAFLVGNAAIDAPLAILNTAMREGGAQHVLPIAVDLFKGYADAFKGILTGQYTGPSTSAFLKGGGGMGFYAAPSATTGAEEVARLRRSTVFDVSSAGDALRLAKDLVALNWVKGLGERVELGPRAMAYSRAMKRGLGSDQAVLQGRTVTVDFAQGGTLAKIVNSFVPFFNPAVQGVATTGRIVREHPRGALLTLGPGLVGPTLAAEAWNRADPERSRAYDDVPQYIKDRGVVVMLPGTPPTDATGETRPQYVVINLRQLAPIAMLTREVYDRAAGRDARTALDLLGGAGAQLSPVSSFASILPPVLGTGLELQQNRDVYRGADIATTRGDARAQAIAGGVNRLAASRGVYTDLRPSQVDYAIRDTSGAYGEMATSGSNLVAGRPRGNAPQDIPVAGGFVRRIVRGDTGQLLQEARGDRLSSPVRIALAEAGIRYDPSPARGDLGGIPLRRDEQTFFQERLNAHTETALTPLVTSPEWRALDKTRQAEQVMGRVDAARQAAAAETRRRIGADELNRRQAELARRTRASAPPR